MNKTSVKQKNSAVDGLFKFSDDLFHINDENSVQILQHYARKWLYKNIKRYQVGDARRCKAQEEVIRRIVRDEKVSQETYNDFVATVQSNIFMEALRIYRYSDDGKKMAGRLPETLALTFVNIRGQAFPLAFLFETIEDAYSTKEEKAKLYEEILTFYLGKTENAWIQVKNTLSDKLSEKTAKAAKNKIPGLLKQQINYWVKTALFIALYAFIIILLVDTVSRFELANIFGDLISVHDFDLDAAFSADNYEIIDAVKNSISGFSDIMTYGDYFGEIAGVLFFGAVAIVLLLIYLTKIVKVLIFTVCRIVYLLVRLLDVIVNLFRKLFYSIFAKIVDKNGDEWIQTNGSVIKQSCIDNEGHYSKKYFSSFKMSTVAFCFGKYFSACGRIPFKPLLKPEFLNKVPTPKKASALIITVMLVLSVIMLINGNYSIFSQVVSIWDSIVG